MSTDTSTPGDLAYTSAPETVSSTRKDNTKIKIITRAKKKSKILTPPDPCGEAGTESSPTPPTKSSVNLKESVIHTTDGSLEYKNGLQKRSDGQGVNLNFTLSEKQIKAQTCTAPILLYGGAKGGGKSWWLCIWVFHNALKYPGNKLFFFRRRSVDFTNTTLETWKKAIPAELYRINEHKKKIFIPLSNSVIDYGGLDDPMLVQSLNSAEYAQGGVDQAEEIERDQFAMLRGTMRHRLPDGSCPPYQIRMTANPAQCWLKEDFLLSPREGFQFVPALPTDNPYLPPDYTKNLAEAFKHRPSLLAAYLHGSWDDMASHDICIQSSWVFNCTGISLKGAPLKRIIVNDPARFGDDENVIYVMEQSERGIYIIDTQILEHKSTMDTAGRLAALRRKWEATLIGVDVIGVGSGVVDALTDLGEPVLSINSSGKPNVQRAQVSYFNLRSQMWGEAAQLFADRQISIPKEDDVLRGQLCSPKFDFVNSRMQIESKDDIKKRLGRSPDRADCLIMGIYTLSQASRLDYAEYRQATEDRVGYGTPVNQHEAHEEGMGVDMDFSGYGL